MVFFAHELKVPKWCVRWERCTSHSIKFHNKLNPKELGAAHVEAWLTLVSYFFKTIEARYVE
jgi:hypothetical protein